MAVSSISRGVYLVDTGGLGYENTVAAYLIVGERGAAFVDVGYGSGVGRLLGAMRSVGVPLEQLRYIVPTHLHLDHSGATGLLASMSRAEVYAHERAVKHLVDPTRLLESVRSIYDEGTYARFGEFRPVEEGRVFVLKDGEELVLGGLTLRANYAPGHAPHHMSILIEENRYLVSADTFSVRLPIFPRPIPTTPPPSFDLEQALESMRRAYDLKPRLLLTPHYGPLMPSEILLEEDIGAYEYWARRSEELYRDGVGVEEAVRVFLEELAGRRGARPHAAAHGFVKISVMGLYAYHSRRSSK